jgi:broad specificity phosphatase PhoE
MTEFWLVRHGQTDWNINRRWQGQSPDAPGLNEIGRAQALELLDQLKDVKLSTIYSSDLLRARQTAELIAKPLGLDIVFEPRLREMHLGEWEGMLASKVETHYPQELEERKRDAFNAHTPGGEALREVAARIIPAMDQIARKHPEESILVVSHGVSLGVIICHVEGIPLGDAYKHIPNNLQPYHVHWSTS